MTLRPRPRCLRVHVPKRQALVLAVAITLALTISLGCSTARGDDRRDLRDFAADESQPQATRLRVLRAILANPDEDPHLRGTAAQMIGLLQIEAGVPDLLAPLGAGVATDDAVFDPQPDPAHYLRLECVEALGRFGRAALYDQLYDLLYLTHREHSVEVRRQFVQSFGHAPSARDAALGDGAALIEVADTADVLRIWLVTALDRQERPSLIWLGLRELRRLTSRPDLDAEDGAQWQATINAIRVAGIEGRPFGDA